VQGHADSIGLVTVRVIGMAVEPRGQAAKAGGRFVLLQKVSRLHHAQTIKTGGPRLPLLQT
jgi:hypothetical protein